MRSSFTTPRFFSPKPLTVILIITLIATFVGLSHEIMYLRSCSIRYEIAKFLNHTCEEVRRYQPMCRRTIKISYSELPPYIFNNETGHVLGIFPGINNFCSHFLIVLKARYLPESVRLGSHILIDLKCLKYISCTILMHKPVIKRRGINSSHLLEYYYQALIYP